MLYLASNLTPVFIMPKSLPARTIKTGSYAAGTAAQVQGKGSNKTQQYLDGIDPHDPGQQGFYREALQVPHPQTGQPMSYGQLQDAMNGPHKAQMLEAYAAQQRLDKTPTADAYLQAMFDHGKADLVQRGAATPGAYAFPASADVARRAPATARAIAHGNYVAPAQGVMQDAPALAQRYEDVAGVDNAYAAPGMAVQPRSIAVAAPERRVIRTTPIVAGN